MFENKKIFILGMARSGYEAAKVLAKRNNRIVITDMSDQSIDHVKELEELGVKVFITKKPIELLDNTFDLVIKNPGISYEHDLIIKANELNIKVVNEVEVGYELMPKDITIIGITGSNGKTTTTTLIYEIIKASGKNVYIGGNIGYPLCSLVDKVVSDDILVLEISGHQLHDMENFKTDISVMTNLYPVHLDFFKTYDFYKEMKTRIFRHHTSSDVAIINGANEDVINAVKDIKSHIITFSSQIKADAYLENDIIYYNNEEIISVKDMIIQGKHNYENAMCSIIAAKQLDISNDIIKSVLTNFKGVEHRIEYVANINNREFYNDSKSTNVDSTITALKSFKRPTILILGGLDRGHSFDGLTPYMNNVKYIISLGQTNLRIKEYADIINKKCIVVNTIKEAVNAAYEVSSEFDIILLSPACASWDQYSNFEERGNDYKNIIKELE